MTKSLSPSVKVIVFFILVFINLILIALIRYLTFDSGANDNSRFGAYLLSFFIPLFLSRLTPDLSVKSRVLNFGLGLLIYSIGIILVHSFSTAIHSGILFSSIICLLTFAAEKKIKHSS